MASSVDSHLAKASVPLPLPFTCNTCRATFENNAIQRLHMREEWHIYNLKRRIASLPPLTSTVFHEQVLPARTTFLDTELHRTSRVSCIVCQKTYSNIRAHQNHLASQKHEVRAAELHSLTLGIYKNSTTSNQNDVPPSINSEESSISAVSGSMVLTSCLFCSLLSPSTELSLEHMYKSHGMFVPDQDNLSNAEGLIIYLTNIVYESLSCLYCGMTKSTIDGLQQHMIDKGHCMINVGENASLGLFYRHSSSDPDTDFEDRREDQGYDSTVSDRDATSLEDDAVSSEYQLHLASGKTIGHRSQARYYRQNLHNHITAAERATHLAIPCMDSDGNTAARTRERRQLVTRGDGGNGMIGVPESQQRALRAVEKKMLQQEVRARNEYRWALERTANQQKHFRPDYPGPPNG
ncbi:hypothetical protein MMC17_008074 [Xylographa soralifera]|nr:hypothetical protein [Xylographa soralifera]